MDSDSAGELNDDALAAEITLLGELVLAASSVERHLTQAEVDRVLGLEVPAPGEGGPSGSARKSKRSRRPSKSPAECLTPGLTDPACHSGG